MGNLGNIEGTLSTISKVFFEWHIIDVIIGVFLIACFLFGLLKRTWFNVTHITTFFILFIITWFAITPLVSSFIANDLLKTIGGLPLPEVDLVLTVSPDILKTQGFNLEQLGLPFAEGGVELSGQMEMHFRLDMSADSIKELFGKLVSISPLVSQEEKLRFIANGEMTQYTTAIVNVMINSLTWIVLVFALLIISPIISLIIYLILRVTLFKKIRKKWNSRLVGAALGLVVPLFLLFVLMQANSVWAGSFTTLIDNLSNMIDKTGETISTLAKDESAKQGFEAFKSITDGLAPITDFLKRLTNPKDVSICFGWMGGEGSIGPGRLFGTLNDGTKDYAAGEAVNDYFSSIFGNAANGDFIHNLHIPVNNGDNILNLEITNTLTVNVTDITKLTPEMLQKLSEHGLDISQSPETLSEQMPAVINQMIQESTNKMVDTLLQQFKEGNLTGWIDNFQPQM